MQRVKKILMLLVAFAVGYVTPLIPGLAFKPATLPTALDCSNLAWTSDGDFCYDAVLGRDHKISGVCCDEIRRRMSRPIRPSSLDDIDITRLPPIRELKLGPDVICRDSPTGPVCWCPSNLTDDEDDDDSSGEPI